MISALHGTVEPSPRRNAVYGSLTALLGICALVLVGRPTWSSSPPPPPRNDQAIEVPGNTQVLGSISNAGASQRIIGRVDGKIVLVGWTAFTDPHLTLGKIAIQVDGVSRGETSRFFTRRDIAAHFGRSDFEQSGWEIDTPLKGLRPGHHDLAVQAFAVTGETYSLPSVELRVIE